LMKQALLTLAILFSQASFAIIYDNYEINQELNQPNLQLKNQQFLRDYFTAQVPKHIVDDLLNNDMPPIQREYILYNLLTEISQQPPQNYHQYVVDLMKSHKTLANRKHPEGNLQIPIFNLSSKAYGIENIWLAYQTEQQLNQLFSQDLTAAIASIQTIIRQNKRPQWLAVKNSLAALQADQQTQLTAYLSQEVNINSGLDRLISQVGLLTKNITLIEKALQSNQQSVREYTLRKLTEHLNNNQTKQILLTAANNRIDAKFSTSLLGQFSTDKNVQSFLINKLDDVKVAENAAFALSQSKDLSLPERLKKHYLQSDQSWVKNHVLLTLKLNNSQESKQVIKDLSTLIEPNSTGEKWIKSFEGAQQ